LQNCLSALNPWKVRKYHTFGIMKIIVAMKMLVCNNVFAFNTFARGLIQAFRAKTAGLYVALHRISSVWLVLQTWSKAQKTWQVF